MRSLPEKKSKQVLWYVSLMLGKRRTISYSYQWWLAIVESKRKKHLQHSLMFSTDRPKSLSPGHLSLDQFATDNWLALYKSYYPFVMTRVNSWFKNQCNLNDLMKLSWWFKRLQSKWWRTQTSWDIIMQECITYPQFTLPSNVSNRRGFPTKFSHKEFLTLPPYWLIWQLRS